MRKRGSEKERADLKDKILEQEPLVREVPEVTTINTTSREGGQQVDAPNLNRSKSSK